MAAPNTAIEAISNILASVDWNTVSTIKAAAGILFNMITIDDVKNAFNAYDDPRTKSQYLEVIYDYGDELFVSRNVDNLGYTIKLGLPMYGNCASGANLCFRSSVDKAALFFMAKYGVINGVAALDTLRGKDPFLEVDENGNTWEIGYGPRWWVVGEDIGTYIDLAKAVGQDSSIYGDAVQEATRMWNWLNDNLWNGDHYIYAVQWSNWEFNAPEVFIPSVKCYVMGGCQSNIDRITIDIYNRYLANGLQSPQWKNGWFVPMHHNPDNNQSRLNDLPATTYMFHALYPMLPSNAKNALGNLLAGQPWKTLYESDVYDANTGKFKMTNDSSPNDDASLAAAVSILLSSIIPGSGHLVLPLVNRIYMKVPYSIPMMRLDINARRLVVPATGSFTVFLGSSPVQVDTGDPGVYEIQFSDDWNNVVNVNRVGDLDPRYVYVTAGGGGGGGAQKIPTHLYLEVEVL